MSARPEIRCIEWVDSAGDDGWVSTGETQTFDMSRCTSVGFVVNEDADKIVLVHSLDATHGNAGGVWAIPKVAITRSTTLRKAAK